MGIAVIRSRPSPPHDFSPHKGFFSLQKKALDDCSTLGVKDPAEVGESGKLERTHLRF